MYFCIERADNWEYPYFHDLLLGCCPSFRAFPFTRRLKIWNDTILSSCLHTNAGIENFIVKFPHQVFLNSNDHAFRVTALLMVQCYILNQHKIIINQLFLPFVSIKMLVVSLLVCLMCMHLDVFWNVVSSQTFNTSSKIYNISCNLLLVNKCFLDTFFDEQLFINDFPCHYYLFIILCYKLLLLILTFLVHLTFLDTCSFRLIVQPGI